MEGRNVHVYSAQDRTEKVGFWQHGRVSISTFYTWLDIVLVCNTSWALYAAVPHATIPRVWEPSGPALQRIDGDMLSPGNYVILSSDSEQPVTITVVQEMPRRRMYSVNYTFTPRSDNFTTRVRERDLRCCISGALVPRSARRGYNFVGFEAAHCFPISEPDEFFRLGYHNLITDPLATTLEKKINSVQQGFLCQAYWHRLFDDYQIGINPDDDYRIVDFQDRAGPSLVDGRIFYINTDVAENLRLVADLLRDHFRQCVLSNLTAAAEPGPDRIFDPEVDLGSGGFDLNNSFWRSDEGQAQFGAEMRGRLLTVQLQRQAPGV